MPVYFKTDRHKLIVFSLVIIVIIFKWIIVIVKFFVFFVRIPSGKNGQDQEDNSKYCTCDRTEQKKFIISTF